MLTRAGNALLGLIWRSTYAFFLGAALGGGAAAEEPRARSLEFEAWTPDGPTGFLMDYLYDHLAETAYLRKYEEIKRSSATSI